MLANLNVCTFVLKVTTEKYTKALQYFLFVANLSIIEVAKQWSHLGHIISYDMDDQYDIMQCHNSLVKQINNVLCFFSRSNSITKLRLLVS